ncbi:MAG TPA: peptidylprolyl isomerase [Treponemataceae bacterium]|jgi:FKBP-type peptidyl-prolyl cis-trans isomerase SlyD|nr:peptidylprolyl isomerase [Treponemataceae bacterium]HQF74124.1 peptidylprolyl isomerase [Treponemataceae bacterium]
MTVTKDSVVGIEYTLTDDKKQTLDSSAGAGPLEYLHGHNNIIPGLEKELDGKSVGDEFTATIAPADAYGERMDNLVVEVSRSQFPDDVEVTAGMQFEAGDANGSRIVTVTTVNGDSVTVDANHPLAGENLHFAVKVVSIREATEDEKKNGFMDSGDDECGCGDDCDCGDDCGSGGCGCGHH